MNIFNTTKETVRKANLVEQKLNRSVQNFINAISSLEFTSEEASQVIETNNQEIKTLVEENEKMLQVKTRAEAIVTNLQKLLVV